MCMSLHVHILHKEKFDVFLTLNMFNWDLCIVKTFLYRCAGSMMSPGSLHDPVHDLPPELLTAGWRRFWSKRESRPYFFNKLTNESMWEMPPLPGASAAAGDPISDPLGIQHENAKLQVTIPPAAVGEKRRASQDLMLSPVKRTMAFNYK